MAFQPSKGELAQTPLPNPFWLRFGLITILYIGCSFKRKSDYVQRVDTILFSFSPFDGPEEDLKSEIGGAMVINRLRKYLEEGPKLSINIFRDRYEVYKHTLEEFPPKVDIVQRLPRKTTTI